jgi:hypothetical protein
LQRQALRQTKHHPAKASGSGFHILSRWNPERLPTD